jgi:hypothetical protein
MVVDFLPLVVVVGFCRPNCTRRGEIELFSAQFDGLRQFKREKEARREQGDILKFILWEKKEKEGVTSSQTASTTLTT